MLLYLPQDIITFLFSFLDNTSVCYLITSSKYIYNIGLNFGYLNSLTFNYTQNIIDFIKIFCNHSKTLSTITFTNFDDPHIWLPNSVKTLIFHNCSITTQFNLPNSYKINTLIYIDHHRTHKINIDWNKFPNLTYLILYVQHINTTDLHNLKHLKTIKLNSKFPIYLPYKTVHDPEYKHYINYIV
jgi:hypothetical protein